MPIHKTIKALRGVAKGVGKLNKNVGSARKAHSANKAVWSAHDDAMKNYRKQEQDALKRYNALTKK